MSREMSENEGTEIRTHATSGIFDFFFFWGTNSWSSVCVGPTWFQILIRRRNDWLTWSSSFLLSTFLSPKIRHSPSITHCTAVRFGIWILQTCYNIAFARRSTSRLWKAWKWHYVNSIVFSTNLHLNSYHLQSISYYLHNRHTLRNLILILF
jgi:hypothetical protein